MKKFRQIRPYVDKNKEALLTDILGASAYKTIKWHRIVKKAPSKGYISDVYDALIERSSAYSTVGIVVSRYGRNAKWASNMQKAINKTAVDIQNNKPLDEVMSNIVIRTSKNVKSTTKIKHTPVTEKFYVHRFQFDRYHCYNEYFSRFKNISNRENSKIREQDYPYINLSTIKMHDKESGSVSVDAGLSNREKSKKIISNCYNNLQGYVQKVNKGTVLNSTEVKSVKDNIAEIYYNFANTMSYYRGMAGISDCLTRSLYKSLGFKQPILRNGTGLDLEALHMTFSDYKKNWDNFFIRY